MPNVRGRAGGRRKKKAKTGRLNLLLDADLKRWVHNYARRKHTTVTAIIIDHFVRLKDKEEGPDVEQI